jgi:hypothetical protein
LLGQRREVSENPHQICALLKIGLDKPWADRRIDLQNAVGEFFDPHGLAYLGTAVNIALSERAIIAPEVGQWKEIFFSMPLRVRRWAAVRGST